MKNRHACHDEPLRPRWVREPDGDFAFVSFCPTCNARIEVQPHGRDMQELHKILRSGPQPAKNGEAKAEPEISPEEAESSAAAMRIWADFKWWSRKQDRTWPDVAEEIAKCIIRCRNEIAFESVKQAAIQKFEMMAARVTEFNLPPEEPPESQEGQ